MWKSGDTIAWQTNTSGGVTGSGGAPDGDEWFAGRPGLRATAGATPPASTTTVAEAEDVDLVRTADLTQSLHLVRCTHELDGNGTDASYMLPAFYQTWACSTVNAAGRARSRRRALVADRGRDHRQRGDQSFAGQATNSGGDDKLRIVGNYVSSYDS